MKPVLLIILLAIFAHWPFSVSATNWPDFPVPDDARLGKTGDRIEMNGVPMKIYGVEFYQHFDDMVRFYRFELDRLSTTPVAEIPTRDNNGIMLFQNDGRFSYSVSLTPQTSNSTAGMIAITDLNGTKKEPYEFQLPMESVVMSDIESWDYGKKARQLNIVHRGEYDLFRDAMIEALASSSYALEPDMYHQKNGRETFFFKGPQREARLVLTHKGNFSFAELITVHMLSRSTILDFFP